LPANPPYDEKNLLCRIAAGDEEAFRQLFHHYNKQLRPFVWKLTRSAQAADEVLQEVFLKIWLHREKLAGLDNPRAYVLRIVSNESMNYLRALVKDSRLTYEIGHGPVAESPSPEESVLYRETERMINEAVEQLPRSCQQIYRMSREESMRIPEIASELNLSNNTVKNQLVKALRLIRLRVAHLLPVWLVCLFLR
jgi:RNA polymerase sigma-70 factor (ECF subfamily)